MSVCGSSPHHPTTQICGNKVLRGAGWLQTCRGFQPPASRGHPNLTHIMHPSLPPPPHTTFARGSIFSPISGWRLRVRKIRQREEKGESDTRKTLGHPGPERRRREGGAGRGRSRGWGRFGRVWSGHPFPAPPLWSARLWPSLSFPSSFPLLSSLSLPPPAVSPPGVDGGGQSRSPSRAARE